MTREGGRAKQWQQVGYIDVVRPEILSVCVRAVILGAFRRFPFCFPLFVALVVLVIFMSGRC